MSLRPAFVIFRPLVPIWISRTLIASASVSGSAAALRSGFVPNIVTAPALLRPPPADRSRFQINPSLNSHFIGKRLWERFAREYFVQNMENN
jgi:hypothetical protein